MARLLALLLLALPMTGGCHAAERGCFAPGTALPDRAGIVADQRLGQSGRDLALALLAGDAAEAQRRLDADPRLARLPIGPHHDMLSVAVAACDLALLDVVLRHDPPLDGVDGRGTPLGLALRATAPDLALRLLKAGASPTPAAAPTLPLDTAVGLNSLGGVALLLDHRADPNVAGRTGNRPLQTALDQEHFRIAELLIDRGADPWAIDSGGGNLGSALAEPMLTRSPEEAQARDRLRARLKRLGWPDPAPPPREIRAMALAGAWPPVPARKAGARPVPEAVLAIIRENAKPR